MTKDPPINHNIAPEFHLSLIQEIFTWVRNIFIFCKSIAFIYKSAWTSNKYKVTYQRRNVFEIWFMGMAAIKILVLLPNIYYKEINWLFACLILNSFLSYWLSYIFHIRSCVALYKSMSSARKYQVWFYFKVTALITIYLISPFLVIDASKESGYWKKRAFRDYPFLMDCTSLVYRK